MVKHRRLIQALSTLAGNANIKGLFTGTIYRGRLKAICFPGLNCYSCPAALGACPLGSLQSVYGFSPFIMSAYVLGFLTLIGVLLGRIVCGFICPFGLFQELLNKIPSAKKNVNKKYFKLKYIILIVFVIIIPFYTFISKGYAVTAFCKYICPAGTIFAGFPLLWANAGLRRAAGSLFYFKVAIALGVMVSSIIVYRPFCKVLCPLGAVYGFFNKYGIIKLTHNNNMCTDCGRCKSVCKIYNGVTFDSPECIRCFECVNSCESGALKVNVGSFELFPKN